MPVFVNTAVYLWIGALSI